MLSRPEIFEDGIVKAMPMLRAFALSLCRDHDRADDLVQDTMLRALASKHLFAPGTNLNAWLMVILRNGFLSSFRKRKREVEDPDGEIAKRVPLEDSPLRKMEASEVLRLIEKLPETWRVPLRLIADGATYDEVAAEIMEHVGTVKSRVNRGRALLRAAEGRA